MDESTLVAAGLIATHELPHCSVALLGNQPRTTTARITCPHGFAIANQLGAQPTRTYRVIAPSNEHGRGFGNIAVPDDETVVYADGVLLTMSQSGAFLEHADCPVGVIVNQRSQRVVMFHAGRPAQTPYDGETIVTTALARIAPHDELDELLVYISGSICGDHFPNETGVAKTHAGRILDEFGPEVFTDVTRLAFNPAELIIAQLLIAGLERRQITYDQLCTFGHSALSSHRQHVMNQTVRTTANLTVVVTT